MLLTNKASIREVILFPTLRPIGSVSAPNADAPASSAVQS